MRKLVKAVFGISLKIKRVRVGAAVDGQKQSFYYLNNADLNYHYDIYKYRARDIGYDDE